MITLYTVYINLNVNINININIYNRNIIWTTTHAYHPTIRQCRFSPRVGVPQDGLLGEDGSARTAAFTSAPGEVLPGEKQRTRGDVMHSTCCEHNMT